MITPQDLIPERRDEVIETIERLRGPEYAKRLQVVSAIIGTAEQCQEAVAAGHLIGAILMSTTVVEMLRQLLPGITGLQAQDIQASVKAQTGDRADIRNKVKKELGL